MKEEYQPRTTADLSMDSGHLKIYIVSDYGTGKSVFASTFPRPGFVFDFDNRIKTYRKYDWDYETFEISSKGWIKFESVLRHIKTKVAEGYYKTVVFDSTTSATDLAMERALTIDPARSPEDGPIWNVHYQICRNLMEPRLHSLINLPCHVVACGHWKITTDSKTGAILKVDPLLTGQLSEKVPGYFDEIYVGFHRKILEGPDKGQTKYFIRTVPLGYFKARSTISGVEKILPDVIPNDYNSLCAAIAEGQAKLAEDG